MEGAPDNLDDDDKSTDDTTSSLHDHAVWSHEQHFRAALQIAPVWFVANWAYNASLAYTSITSSTVLASTGSLFTFLFAVLYGDETFTCFKLMGVLLGVSGSIITGLHDVQSSWDTPVDEDAHAIECHTLYGRSCWHAASHTTQRRLGRTCAMGRCARTAVGSGIWSVCRHDSYQVSEGRKPHVHATVIGVHWTLECNSVIAHYDSRPVLAVQDATAAGTD